MLSFEEIWAETPQPGHVQAASSIRQGS